MENDGLSEYRRRRDARLTPEPFGGSPSPAEPVFVVQRHRARRLHYDLRLERGGALASWAVPKGIPLEPGGRVLAVHVEDHPLEYATFEGEIPAGQYGAGTVEIWDSGTYELVEEKRDGGLTVRLRGRRLEGLWTLVPAALDGEPKNWLLLRKRDAAPAPARREYRPMLATLAQDVPRGGDWLFEVKWDGYRALAYLRGGEVRLVSRNGVDLTSRFRHLAGELEQAVRTPDAVLDGEVCALDAEGRPSFSAMQQAEPQTPLVYEVFDLLELERQPLVELPFAARRERLEQVLDRSSTHVRLSETFEDGVALFEAATRHELEGIVAKRADSAYREGRRSRAWVKVKTRPRQEFLVAGYTRGQGRREGTLGALVLAVRDGAELRWAGNVGSGFDDRELERFCGLLAPLERPTCPFPSPPAMPRARRGDVVWVEPRLVVEVEFSEWTHEGRLRAPSYVGLRDDRPPEAVRREEPFPDELREGRRVLRFGNLDKVFWPLEGITKGDLLAYYQAVAPVLLPHLRDRPFTLKRYPDGIAGKAFFQKDAPSHMPSWIPTRAFAVAGRDAARTRRTIRVPVVNDELALLWMVNMGCVDLNTWYSRIDRPERPDWVLFDLDPAAGAGFPEVVEVALLVREVLTGLGLVSFPKTSGSDGMHVLVPIARRSTYEETRRFAEIVAGTLARTHQGLVTTEWTKAKRRGVLIDSNQNGEGKTIATAYSVRPQAGAPVSTPLRWEEVDERLDPAAFTMEAVLERVAREGDLLAGLLTTRQSLGRALASLR